MGRIAFWGFAFNLCITQYRADAGERGSPRGGFPRTPIAGKFSAMPKQNEKKTFWEQKEKKGEHRFEKDIQPRKDTKRGEPYNQA